MQKSKDSRFLLAVTTVEQGYFGPIGACWTLVQLRHSVVTSVRFSVRRVG